MVRSERCLFLVVLIALAEILAFSTSATATWVDNSDSSPVATNSDYWPEEPCVPGDHCLIQTACCGSCWSATAEALFMHRDTAAEFGLMYDLTSGAELLNTSDLSFDFEVGPRVRLERSIACGRVVELSYFGINGWSSSAEFGPGNYRVIGDASRSGPDVDTASFNYDSSLHTIEINVRSTSRPWFQPLAGFRWLQLDEEYRVAGDGDFGIQLPYVLTYDTTSNLYGGQLGGLLTLWDQGGPLRIVGVGKAGVYACDATNRGRFDADFIQFEGNGATGRTAFVGELGLTASYQITYHWSLTAGYEALWLDGVALAPNQIAVTDIADQTGGITTDGDLLFHGIHVGLQAAW